MNGARDIAGITIPYAVGVLLTVYAGTSLCRNSVLIHILTLSGIVFITTLLLYRDHWKPDHIATESLTIPVMGICGVLSGLTGLSSELALPVSPVESYAIGLGERIQHSIDAIPFRYAHTGALIKALLTGERSSLPKELTEAFRDSGASHILALSGLHLGIIYGILSGILSLAGNSKRAQKWRSVIMILICGMYTMATGAGASIVRAFIFILLGEAGKLTGRHNSLSHTLMTALMIQLTFSPLSARNVGFQLSYAAMAGIAFIYPWIKGLWPEEDAGTSMGALFGKLTRRIWNSLALSIACQITTGPLAFLYFDTFPRYFLLTNLLSLPLTGILIPSALLTLCLSIMGHCPQMLINITEMLARTLTWSLEVIASM